jgi:hypothetical protein
MGEVSSFSGASQESEDLLAESFHTDRPLFDDPVD